MRARVDGSGCYDAIIPHYPGAGAGSARIRNIPKTGSTMSAAPSPSTIWTSADDVLRDGNSLGFDQISVEPVVADAKLPYALIREEDLPAGSRGI